MPGFNLLQRWARVNGGASAPANASDLADLIDTNQGAVQLSVPADITGLGLGKIAYGTGTLVTGAVVVATGLTTVISFQAMRTGTGATATGATEVDTLTVASITTGAVTVQGSYHSGTAAVMVPSVSGTAAFRWVAFGT